MTKEILNQYYDLRKEIKEVRERIVGLETKIEKLEDRIRDIEAGETVKDKVRGGLGGLQSFTIEGIPTREYNEKKMELKIKRMILEERRKMLSVLELDSLNQIAQIEHFISEIKDSHIRRIVHLRIVDGRSWNEVADCIGGGNTEDSVRMAFNRCVK
jgi:chromosome segregation ATPase